MEIEFSGNVHLVAGGNEMIERVLEALGAGIESRGNPDIFIREYLQFGIGGAGELRSRASSRAIKEKNRFFIIVAPNMTADAQNALLKILEEPSADASFFIITPSPESLLATLRSRAQTLLLSQGSEQKGKIDIGVFLKSDKSKRIEMVKVLLPREDEERDLGSIISFLSSLERELDKTGAGKMKVGLEAIYRARKYATDKGSLLKTLLEQVALLVPRV